jgi:glycerophosphoryl diester phosphodiesterase
MEKKMNRTNPVFFYSILVCVLLLINLSVDAVEIVCHRGANKFAPENTRAATQRCIDWGVEYVEIDVRASKDGVFYILHDSTVNRTSDGGRVLIRELTSEQVDRLDAGSWFDPRFKNERIPRLEPYLQWVKGKIKVYLDVKGGDLQKLIDLVYKTEMQNDCFFWFGSRSQARRFRELDPILPLKINASNIEGVLRAKNVYKAQIIETGLKNATPEFIETCRENDLEIMIIQMSDDEEAFRKIIQLKADKVNLDHGNIFKRIEREEKGIRTVDLYDSESYKHRTPILILHRGGVITPQSPECSLRAIYLAAQEGYEMVELDIRESSDHIPVVFHDRNMKKSCGIDKRIEELTAEEIRTIRYENSDQWISTLDEMVSVCNDLALGIMLDIKSDGSEQFFKTIANLIEKYDLQKSTVCISGHPLVRKYLNKKSMMTISKEQLNQVAENDATDLTGLFWFGLPWNITDEMVSQLQKRDVIVIPAINTFRYPQGSPHSPSRDIQRMKKLGVNFFQIDSVYGQYFQ